MSWFIGLMSGTSLDGVDAVLAEADTQGRLQSQAHVHSALPQALRDELLALNQSGPDELHRAALAAHALVDIYASAVAAVLTQSGLTALQVKALGAHGQTVRHRPQEFSGCGYTLQLMNGALLAERCGIDVVCDFRSRDVAAGGQGAPLVPAFHAACFGMRGEARAVLNLGGIANLSLLGAQGEVAGFDCGPGNLLMDLWCRQHRGQAYDDGGRWAAQGQIDAGLLSTLMAEPFFARHPPKSTGRDLFDAAWLAKHLAGPVRQPTDVMATLAELTARAAIEALQRESPGTSTLLVCGGGAFNAHLMSRLKALAGPARRVDTTAGAGVQPDQVEALAFAWLARAHLAREPGNIAAVTGAVGGRVLGALYPAA
ncbi:MAG: anhydro-N-acetylmuramic acid kinase [Rubrivivax sp.]|nr:anhydro-N-acetylmuramic acid kinase [Rubrivivax sp.]